CFEYDGLNRLTRKGEGNTADPCAISNELAAYTYDTAQNGAGQLAQLTWPGGSDTFFYDNLGRMVRQDRQLDNRVYTMQTLSYDALNRPLQIRYPNGEVVTMTYDREGENSLKAGNDWLVNDVRYNAQGQMTYLNRQTGADTTYRYYTPSGRLKQINTASVLSLNYGYDPVGNITSIFDGTQNETSRFDYDFLNRLTNFETTAGAAQQVTIRARGSNADGWPVMQLRVNGSVIQEWTVNSSSWQNYTAQATLTGSDQIDVVFTNDHCVASGCANGDRNLYVDYFVVNGQTVQAESGSVQFDRGEGAAAFDGVDVLAGTQNLYWAGALRTTVTSAVNWTPQEQYAYDTIGNMTNFAGVGYGYGQASGIAPGAKPHAVTHLGGAQKFWYDANGNMTQRNDAYGNFTQTWDAENRLTLVTTGGVKGKSGHAAFLYGSPNGSGSVTNGGIDAYGGGFGDINRRHEYSFTFAPGVTVSDFSLRMLDYGDYFPNAQTSHTITLTAYDADDNVVDSDTLSFTTTGGRLPRGGSAGDLWYTGDAGAAEGQPGNYVYSVAGNGIARLALSFTADGVSGAADPYFAMTDVCFTVSGGGRSCADFSRVPAGLPVEGLGRVHPDLNIQAGGS
ncbi:MAG TPA: hypothetical protein ENK32_02380, partial [Anaerolineae bacterium]|nr:hypothetical protein [Anaerolineae bacterium]